MTVELPDRTSLAMLPTPLVCAPRLSQRWGGPQIWIKRDDLTGFELSGNKVRKLEFHFAAAKAAHADTIVTCGALQSNHARATALAAARLGMRCILFLRNSGTAPPSLNGNYLLDRLAGAEVRLITIDEWASRNEIMAARAADENRTGHKTWVIPEGASDALGMWGYVLAMRELADQAALISGNPATLWHAASSGGTTAGIGWAVHRLGLDTGVVACSIGDPSPELAAKVEAIWDEAIGLVGGTRPDVSIEYNDRHLGGGYGVVSNESLAIQAEATSLTGMVFDPTYTGKALVGLKTEIDEGRYSRSDNVIFWHTGGGFAAFSHDFSRTTSVEDLDG